MLYATSTRLHHRQRGAPRGIALSAAGEKLEEASERLIGVGGGETVKASEKSGRRAASRRKPRDNLKSVRR